VHAIVTGFMTPPELIIAAGNMTTAAHHLTHLGQLRPAP
jgi:hypothetical protein